MKGKKKRIGFSNALSGILAVYRAERNFRIHLFATCVVIVVGFIFKLTLFEWVAVLLVIGMVIVSELFNTAIEKIIDYVKPETHPEARFIKDAAAGAVLISSITAVIIGLLLFLPKLFS